MSKYSLTSYIIAFLMLPILFYLFFTSTLSSTAQVPQIENPQPSTTIQTSPQSQPSVKLAVKPIEPFIIVKDGQYSGFSIDLWNILSKRVGLSTSETQENTNVKDLIESVETKKADVGIAGISITSEREQKVDFSYPMFRSGLSILTNADAKQGVVPVIFTQIGGAIFNKDFGILTLFMIGISFIPAIFLYLAEKRKIDGFLDNENFFVGVFASYWWCVTAIFGQQDQHPNTKSGKVFGIIWIIFGVLFLAFFTAQITANLTTEQLNGSINSLSDLQDKKVAVIKNTTSVNFLKEKSIDYLEFSDLKEAVESVDKGETKAVIYDKPALDFYASKDKEKYKVVGGILTTEDYGIALPSGSPLRKKINEELLKMYQNGEYNDLKAKWFGKDSGN
jgi:polar amino acid transport system substrate-binding protein